ncbi:ATP-dependent DNA helicase [Prauserella marina]|uniref:DNA 3'-5' helicase n=1 Tax=Prauserella marina TaxID=530584 RepID=A0A222VKB6_9PSEU|nr:UvrD-helicase domain-containing protein [Prauserella marina]ASR34358.1 ATP-dependent DNA helicase [Prauserella marina]PWV71852.1 DNA helicase-2/ATP-dependent DNA helicase PcrA [Prauserella marina]SDD89329.1 DNA helicase-2 / ATP-dependent DNA helicase PcrA [Prauserella marina]
MNLVTPFEIAQALGLHSPTEEQAAVIAAPPEPALVVAGAGAGKTETMAARVVWLVANGLVVPERVLGLTFTRKAARQLADRVRARLRRLAGSGLLDRIDPGGSRRMAVLTGEPTVLTYHAYAGRLLAEHGLRLPVPPGARMLSETASWQIAHRVVSTWDNDLDTDRVPASVTAQVLSLAGELGEHLVDPRRLRSYTEWLTRVVESAPRAKGQRANLPVALADIVAAQRFRLDLLPLVEAYQQRKRAEGALDFADQMSLAATLADTHPEVVEGERDRYGAVLLDEYQDTGHAQRVLLRSLFGGQRPMPVTAVGDPLQAIYGWRGASAANLPRFTTDFPRLEGLSLGPASEYGMVTSFRNPPEVLTLANAVAEPLREQGLGVRRLRAREGTGPADVRCALLTDVRAEREWLAETMAEAWFSEKEAKGAPPTAAVLVRRRADMAPVAAALRERGLPVEVVGLGGLLDEPEVADLVATLRVLAEPLSGTAAARLLTGARWRFAAADLGALWRRAGELATDGDVLVAEKAEQTGLVDAIDDPGDGERYSPEGYARIRRLGGELAALRRRLDQPLPELVADVERTMLLDVEALARPGGAGRAHLDAFADVVTEYAENSPTGTLLSFLDYLATAEHAEDGLPPGEVEVVADRVQVLTAHSAKGLEWHLVAVPHLVRDTFPGKRRSSSWLRTVPELPATLRGDAPDLPDLVLHESDDRKQVLEACTEHEERFAQRHAEEERRLCYVALTRAEHALLCSGHWWNETSAKPKGPSEFLTEIADTVAADDQIGSIVEWAEEPAVDDVNPLTSASRSLVWPVDPLGARRDDVRQGADLVLDALAELDLPLDEDDPDGWIADTDVLLAEREKAHGRADEVPLPGALSVSQLVELAGKPEALARKLRRPLPFPPNAYARRGTAFHGWLERRFDGDRLLEIDDLPGAADVGAAPDSELDALRDAFERSTWAHRTPHDVEVPFSTDIGGVTVRGRMDAVFADPDGGWTVVDWKTGAVPEGSALPALSVQLAAYRLAWAGLSGTPLEKVRAAFHYVRHDRTLRPVDLLDGAGLRELLRSVPDSG